MGSSPAAANYTAPTTLLPSTAAPESHPRPYNMSTLGAVLCLLGLVAIPTLIYAFFFAFSCPPNPFLRRRRRGGSSGEPDGEFAAGKMESISKVIMLKKEMASGECPVCLSAFLEGEEMRQLKACGHSFHVACIDRWLNTHSNCPVCRASLPLKRSNKTTMAAATLERDIYDLRQGLPDSANLI